MAVFRIDKIKDYTVMSNHHLRNKELSLRAKGLFSVILSLPDDWDYTVKGLAYICKEGADSIRGALKELEQQGYIERSRVRNEKGQLTTAEYIIHERPEDISKPSETKPTQDEPMQTSPMSENPVQAKPIQLNTNISNTKKLNTDVSNTYPIQSANAEPIGADKMSKYRQLVKENIEYDILTQKLKSNVGMLNEIVEIIVETVCTSRNELTVASDTYPAEIVKSKLLKLNSEHIEYVIDCMKSNTTDIRSIRKYLLAALFNAPSTIDSYYTAKVNHDIYGGGRNEV